MLTCLLRKGYNMIQAYLTRKWVLVIICAAILFEINGCQSNSTSLTSTATNPQSTVSAPEQEKEIIPNIFGGDYIDQYNWERFVRESDFRLATAKDFSINLASIKNAEIRHDIESAMTLPWVGHDINGDGKSERVCIVVNKHRTDKKRFGLIVFEGSGVKDTTDKLYPNVKWVYKDTDLSNKLLHFNLREGGAILAEYFKDRYIKSCVVVWRERDRKSVV